MILLPGFQLFSRCGYRGSSFMGPGCNVSLAYLCRRHASLYILWIDSEEGLNLDAFIFVDTSVPQRQQAAVHTAAQHE